MRHASLGIPLRVVIHHSASRRSTTYDQVRAWHLARRPTPFREFGYHFWIPESGIPRASARPIPELGAHVAGANYGSIGVCIAGDNTVRRSRWNLRQVEGLRGLADSLIVVWPALAREFWGHCQIAAEFTECPGLDVKALLAGSLRLDL